jgi:hypothetical protein
VEGSVPGLILMYYIGTCLDSLGSPRETYRAGWSGDDAQAQCSERAPFDSRPETGYLE